MIGRLALVGLIVALNVTSPVEAESPPASPAAAPSAMPSPAVTAITSPNPVQAATCESLEVLPERCYLLGSARVTLRGAIRRSVTWPLQLGIGATSDYTPSIGLRYGPQDTKRLAIDLPGVPGESTTPEDGDSAGPGEAQLWWSLPDSVASYGHACTVRYDADAVGRLTGGIRCPSERTARGQRYRVEVTFDAHPVVPSPLPTPEPTPVPAPRLWLTSSATSWMARTSRTSSGSSRDPSCCWTPARASALGSQVTTRWPSSPSARLLPRQTSWQMAPSAARPAPRCRSTRTMRQARRRAPGRTDGRSCYGASCEARPCWWSPWLPRPSRPTSS